MAITVFLSCSPGLLNRGSGGSLSGTCSSFQRLLSNCNCSIGGLSAPLLGAGFLYHILSSTDLNFNCSTGGPEGPSAGCWFSLPHLISNSLTSCLHPCYIIVQRPPSYYGHHKSHSIQLVHGREYILIFFDRMHLLFTLVHFLFWQLGRGQYVTAGRQNRWIHVFPQGISLNETQTTSSRCCVPKERRNDDTSIMKRHDTFLYKNITLSSLLLEIVETDCRCVGERQRQGNRGLRLLEDCYIDPYILNYVDSIFSIQLGTQPGAHCPLPRLAPNTSSALTWL